MKSKRIIVLLMGIIASGMSGCAAPLAGLSGLVPSLVPSMDFSSVNVNMNQVDCYKGSWFSSDYCSVPISRFAALSISYASIDNAPKSLKLNINDPLVDQTFFDMIHSKDGIESMNQAFLMNYPDAKQFAEFPKATQDLYVKMKERYILKKNYDKLYASYMYLYTLAIMDEALRPCERGTVLSPQEVRHKIFALQFSNDVLYNVSSSLSGKYDGESGLYNKFYKEILLLNPYKLENLANSILIKMNKYYPQEINSNLLFSKDGILIAELGSFSCNKHSAQWLKYDHDYFGINTSGIDLRVKFKLRDNFDGMSGLKTTNFSD
ncbi:MAG: hypothetical protein PHC75_08595 [Burkholderiales bacterium]|nr:hypothetical protein [Burkholderiales bacterium]